MEAIHLVREEVPHYLQELYENSYECWRFFYDNQPFYVELVKRDSNDPWTRSYLGLLEEWAGNCDEDEDEDYGQTIETTSGFFDGYGQDIFNAFMIARKKYINEEQK